MKKTTTTDLNETPNIGDDVVITKVNDRNAFGGTWVCGTIAGHRFNALVFAEHAENPAWEIGDSRISNLWLKRLVGGRVRMGSGIGRGGDGRDGGGDRRLLMCGIGGTHLRAISPIETEYPRSP